MTDMSHRKEKPHLESHVALQKRFPTYFNF